MKVDLLDIVVNCEMKYYCSCCWYPFSRHILYKPNSTKPDFLVDSINVLYYIYIYIYILSIVQSHMIYWGNWGSVATKWVRDNGSTSGSWTRSCTRNFHPKRVIMLLLFVTQSFCPKPFFPLKFSWLLLAKSSC